jgi:hypothetical protein
MAPSHDTWAWSVMLDSMTCYSLGAMLHDVCLYEGAILSTMATFVSTNVVILSTISLHTRHHAIKHDAPALARCHEHGHICRKKIYIRFILCLSFQKELVLRISVMELELNGGFFLKRASFTNITDIDNVELYQCANFVVKFRCV